MRETIITLMNRNKYLFLASSTLLAANMSMYNAEAVTYVNSDLSNIFNDDIYFNSGAKLTYTQTGAINGWIDPASSALDSQIYIDNTYIYGVHAIGIDNSRLKSITLNSAGLALESPSGPIFRHGENHYHLLAVQNFTFQGTDNFMYFNNSANPLNERFVRVDNGIVNNATGNTANLLENTIVRYHGPVTFQNTPYFGQSLKPINMISFESDGSYTTTLKFEETDAYINFLDFRQTGNDIHKVYIGKKLEVGRNTGNLLFNAPGAIRTSQDTADIVLYTGAVTNANGQGSFEFASDANFKTQADIGTSSNHLLELKFDGDHTVTFDGGGNDIYAPITTATTGEGTLNVIAAGNYHEPIGTSTNKLKEVHFNDIDQTLNYAMHTGNLKLTATTPRIISFNEQLNSAGLTIDPATTSSVTLNLNAAASAHNLGAVDANSETATINVNKNTNITSSANDSNLTYNVADNVTLTHGAQSGQYFYADVNFAGANSVMNIGLNRGSDIRANFLGDTGTLNVEMAHVAIGNYGLRDDVKVGTFNFEHNDAANSYGLFLHGELNFDQFNYISNNAATYTHIYGYNGFDIGSVTFTGGESLRIYNQSAVSAANRKLTGTWNSDTRFYGDASFTVYGDLVFLNTVSNNTQISTINLDNNGSNASLTFSGGLTGQKFNITRDSAGNDSTLNINGTYNYILGNIGANGANLTNLNINATSLTADSVYVDNVTLANSALSATLNTTNLNIDTGSSSLSGTANIANTNFINNSTLAINSDLSLGAVEGNSKTATIDINANTSITSSANDANLTYNVADNITLTQSGNSSSDINLLGANSVATLNLNNTSTSVNVIGSGKRGTLNLNLENIHSKGLSGDNIEVDTINLDGVQDAGLWFNNSWKFNQLNADNTKGMTFYFQGYGDWDLGSVTNVDAINPNDMALIWLENGGSRPVTSRRITGTWDPVVRFSNNAYVTVYDSLTFNNAILNYGNANTANFLLDNSVNPVTLTFSGGNITGANAYFDDILPTDNAGSATIVNLNGGTTDYVWKDIGASANTITNLNINANTVTADSVYTDNLAFNNGANLTLNGASSLGVIDANSNTATINLGADTTVASAVNATGLTFNVTADNITFSSTGNVGSSGSQLANFHINGNYIVNFAGANIYGPVTLAGDNQSIFNINASTIFGGQLAASGTKLNTLNANANVYLDRGGYINNVNITNDSNLELSTNFAATHLGVVTTDVNNTGTIRTRSNSETYLYDDIGTPTHHLKLINLGAYQTISATNAVKQVNVYAPLDVSRYLDLISSMNGLVMHDPVYTTGTHMDLRVHSNVTFKDTVISYNSGHVSYDTSTTPGVIEARGTNNLFEADVTTDIFTSNSAGVQTQVFTLGNGTDPMTLTTGYTGHAAPYIWGRNSGSLQFDVNANAHYLRNNPQYGADYADPRRGYETIRFMDNAAKATIHLRHDAGAYDAYNNIISDDGSKKGELILKLDSDGAATDSFGMYGTNLHANSIEFIRNAADSGAGNLFLHNDVAFNQFNLTTDKATDLYFVGQNNLDLGSVSHTGTDNTSSIIIQNNGNPGIASRRFTGTWQPAVEFSADYTNPADFTAYGNLTFEKQVTNNDSSGNAYSTIYLDNSSADVNLTFSGGLAGSKEFNITRAAAGNQANLTLDGAYTYSLNDIGSSGAKLSNVTIKANAVTANSIYTDRLAFNKAATLTLNAASDLGHVDDNYMSGIIELGANTTIASMGDSGDLTVNFNAPITLTLNGDSNATYNFQNNDATINIADGVTMAVSSINSGGIEKGNLTFAGAAWVSHDIGADGAAINVITAGAAGRTVSFSSPVFAKAINFSSTGTISSSANVTAAIDFVNNGATYSQTAGTLDGSITSTAGVNGTVNLSNVTNVTGSITNVSVVDLASTTVTGAVDATTAKLNAAILNSTLDATTIEIEAGNSSVAGAINATNINYTAAGQLTANADVTAAIDFGNFASTYSQTAGTLTGSITSTGGVNGTVNLTGLTDVTGGITNIANLNLVNMTDVTGDISNVTNLDITNSTISGTVAATTAKLDGAILEQTLDATTIEIEAGNSSVAGVINATNINYTAAGQLTANADVTAAIDFGNFAGTYSQTAGTLTGSITSTGGVNGTVNLTGLTDVTGNITNIANLYLATMTDVTGDISNVTNLDVTNSTISGTVAATTAKLDGATLEQTLDATTIEIEAGNSSVAGAINAANINYTAAGSLTAAENISSAINFAGYAGSLNIADAANITGAIDSTGSAAGIVTFLGDSTVSGIIGATNAISLIKGAAATKTVTFDSIINADEIRAISTGDFVFNASVTAPLNFSNYNATATYSDGVNHTGSITTTANGKGNLIFNGDSAVNGNIGANGLSLNSIVMAGANGKTLTFNNPVFASALNFLNTGAIQAVANVTANIDFNSNAGTYSQTAGTLTGSIGSTGGAAGIVNFANNTTLTGSVADIATLNLGDNVAVSGSVADVTSVTMNANSSVAGALTGVTNLTLNSATVASASVTQLNLNNGTILGATTASTNIDVTANGGTLHGIVNTPSITFSGAGTLAASANVTADTDFAGNNGTFNITGVDAGNKTSLAGDVTSSSGTHIGSLNLTYVDHTSGNISNLNSLTLDNADIAGSVQAKNVSLKTANLASSLAAEIISINAGVSQVAGSITTNDPDGSADKISFAAAGTLQAEADVTTTQLDFAGNAGAFMASGADTNNKIAVNAAITSTITADRGQVTYTHVEHQSGIIADIEKLILKNSSVASAVSVVDLEVGAGDSSLATASNIDSITYISGGKLEITANLAEKDGALTAVDFNDQDGSLYITGADGANVTFNGSITSSGASRKGSAYLSYVNQTGGDLSNLASLSITDNSVIAGNIFDISSLTIDDGSKVTGDIYDVNDITAIGDVEGNVEADNTLSLDGSNITGNVEAVTIYIDAADDSSIGGNVTGAVNYRAAKILDVAGIIYNNVDFQNNEGTLRLADGANADGAIDSTSGNAGTLILDGSSIIAGIVGGTNNLTEIKLGANGSASSFTDAVNADAINYTGTGQVTFNNDINAPINFGSNDGQVILANNVNVTEAIDAGADATGSITFLGNSTVTSTLGATKLLKEINAGATGSLVRFTQPVRVSNNAINFTGTGEMKFEDSLTGAVDFAGFDGTLTLLGTDADNKITYNGAITSSVDSNKGIADLSYVTHASGNIDNLNSLSLIGSSIAGTIDDVTTVTIDATSSVADSMTNIGTLNLNGGTVADVAATTINIGAASGSADTVAATDLKFLGAYSFTVNGNTTADIDMQGFDASFTQTAGTLTGDVSAANNTLGTVNLNGADYAAGKTISSLKELSATASATINGAINDVVTVNIANSTLAGATSNITDLNLNTSTISGALSNITNLNLTAGASTASNTISATNIIFSDSAELTATAAVTAAKIELGANSVLRLEAAGNNITDYFYRNIAASDQATVEFKNADLAGTFNINNGTLNILPTAVVNDNISANFIPEVENQGSVILQGDSYQITGDFKNNVDGYNFAKIRFAANEITLDGSDLNANSYELADNMSLILTNGASLNGNNYILPDSDENGDISLHNSQINITIGDEAGSQGPVKKINNLRLSGNATAISSAYAKNIIIADREAGDLAGADTAMTLGYINATNSLSFDNADNKSIAVTLTKAGSAADLSGTTGNESFIYNESFTQYFNQAAQSLASVTTAANKTVQFIASQAVTIADALIDGANSELSLDGDFTFSNEAKLNAASAKLTIEDGATASGAITAAVNNYGILDFAGSSNFTANIGSNTERLARISLNGASSSVTLSGVTYANLIEVNNSSDLILSGNITANIDFKNNDQTVTLNDGVTLTGNIDSSTAIASNGIVILQGSATIDGVLGATNNLRELQAGADGANISLDNVNADTIRFIGTGLIDITGDVNSNIDLNNKAATYSQANGTLTGSITSTGGVNGTVNLTGLTDVTGNISNVANLNLATMTDVTGNISNVTNLDITNSTISGTVAATTAKLDGATLEQTLNATTIEIEAGNSQIAGAINAANINYTAAGQLTANADVTAAIDFAVNAGTFIHNAGTFTGNIGSSVAQAGVVILNSNAVINNITNNGLSQLDLAATGGVVEFAAAANNLSDIATINFIGNGEVIFNSTPDQAVNINANNPTLTFANNVSLPVITTHTTNNGNINLLGNNGLTGNLGTDALRFASVGLGAGNYELSAGKNIYANQIKLLASDTVLAVKETPESDLIFEHATAQINVDDNVNITQAIDAAAADQGVLVFTGNSEVSAAIGANNKLKEIQFGADGTVVKFNNPVSVSNNTYNFTGSGEVQYGNQVNGNINFKNFDGTIRLLDNALINDRIYNEQSGKGRLILDGNSKIIADIGASNSPIEYLEVASGSPEITSNIYAEALNLISDNAELKLSKQPNAAIDFSANAKLTIEESLTRSLTVTGGLGRVHLATDRVNNLINTEVNSITFTANNLNVNADILKAKEIIFADNGVLNFQKDVNLDGKVTFNNNQINLASYKVSLDEGVLAGVNKITTELDYQGEGNFNMGHFETKAGQLSLAPGEDEFTIDLKQTNAVIHDGDEFIFIKGNAKEEDLKYINVKSPGVLSSFKTYIDNGNIVFKAELDEISHVLAEKVKVDADNYQNIEIFREVLRKEEYRTNPLLVELSNASFEEFQAFAEQALLDEKELDIVDAEAAISTANDDTSLRMTTSCIMNNTKAIAAGEKVKFTPGVWTEYKRSEAKQNKNKNTAHSHKSFSDSITLGADVQFENNDLVGLAASLVNSKSKYQANFNKGIAKTEAKILTLYGLKNLSYNLFSATSISAGVNHRRQQSLVNNKVSKKALDFAAFNTRFGASYGFNIVVVVPYAAYSFEHINVHAQKNTANNFKAVQGFNLNNHKLGAGLNIAMNISHNNILIRPFANIEYIKQLNNKPVKYKFNLTGIAEDFHQSYKPNDTKKIHSSLGIKISSEKYSVNAKYSASFANKYREHAGSVNLKVRL